MTKFEDLSLIKRIGIILLLLLIAFIISGAIGYLSGLDGDSINTRQTTSWELKTKIGFLWMSLPIMGAILSVIGDFLKNLLKLKLPHFLNTAILLGCAFAIFNSISVLLEIETGEFWSKVLSGFVMGSISGAISEILIQKTKKTELNDNSAIEDSTS